MRATLRIVDVGSGDASFAITTTGQHVPLSRDEANALALRIGEEVDLPCEVVELEVQRRPVVAREGR